MNYRSRDRVARALAHQESDRIPFDAIGCGVAAESAELPADYREYVHSGEFRYLTFQPPAGDRRRFGPFLPGLPEGAKISYWGVGRVPITTPDGFHAGHTYWHPLAAVDTVQALRRYPFPKPNECPAKEVLTAAVATAKAQGFTVVGAMSQTILETAYVMRGIEQLFVDFYERPDYVEALFAILGEWRRFQARVLATAGVDVLRLGDDIATQESLMVGLDTYRHFIRPHHAATIAAARAVNPAIAVLYHSDGNLTPLLPDLVSIGVTAINPVQAECMDLREVKREFGRDLTLWGCMPVQSIYARGTAVDVLAHVRFLMEEIAPGGGFVAQFYNMLHTPRIRENVQTFFAAFHRMHRNEDHA
ncbi:MAG: hypothetical protein HN904_18615 [Victivallales bacterium]|nr:hypothetical protein [Victivallales bacterium]